MDSGTLPLARVRNDVCWSSWTRSRIHLRTWFEIDVISNRGPYDDAVSKANVAVLPECGHFPMIDDPALFVKEVNRLIDAVAR
jgi:hypothetical protein